MTDPSTEVTVYRTRTCPFCVMAAEFLDDLQITYREVYLDDHPDRRGFTASLKPGHFTVPLVMAGDHAVGGMDDLRALHGRGELIPLLRRNGLRLDG